MVDEPLLEQQKRYYRDRAPEYDDWWYRRGRYDRGEAHNARWYAEAELVRAQLERCARGGHVLELAAGTGTWTRHLVELFDRVTAVDAAAETLAINREQVASEKVGYVQQDLYQLDPEAPFDFVFFGFWISHVPADRFAGFWQRVDRWLKPGGHLFFLDGYYAANAESRRDEYLLHESETQARDLSDGRQYEIVKRYYNPPRLEAQLRELGWDVTVSNTPSFFLYGHGMRA